MSACYINVQFFAINCCKLFSTVLNCTTAIKAWKLPQHRRTHEIQTKVGLDWTAAGIGGSVCVNYLCPVEAGGGCMSDFWKDYEPEPSMTAPVQENTMIYKTFEQWKNGNVLEHGVPRTEYYSEDQLDLVEMGWNYGYDAGRAVEQALDKKAENARALGLDYEPVGWWDSKIGFFEEKHFDQLQPLYTTPPAAQRQWTGLTDDEIDDLYQGAGKNDLKRAREIEAKLKEKNT
jgi:hypothetical protein